MAERVDTGGLATVLQLLGARGEAPGVAGEQVDLFEADAPLPLAPRAVEATGKAGRPAGTRNKSTEEWVKYFLSRHRSPLTALAELYSRPLGELVDELQAMSDKHKRWKPGSETRDGYWECIQINPLEVLKMQQQAMVALLPYVHRKQPMAIEVENRPRGIVVIGDMDVTDLQSDDDLALPLPPEQYQQVSASPPAPVGQPKSDEPQLSSSFNGMTDADI